MFTKLPPLSYDGYALYVETGESSSLSRITLYFDYDPAAKRDLKGDLLRAFLRFALSQAEMIWERRLDPGDGLTPFATLQASIPRWAIEESTNNSDSSGVTWAYYRSSSGDEVEILTEDHLLSAMDKIKQLPVTLRGQCGFRLIIDDHVLTDDLEKGKSRVDELCKGWLMEADAASTATTGEIDDDEELELDDDEDDAPLSKRQRVKRRFRILKQALKLPEIGRLLRTGLYTPKYLEQQIKEICNSLINSICGSFNKLTL